MEAVVLAHSLPEPFELVDQAATLEDPAHQVAKVIGFERLGDEVVRAAAHGIQRDLGVTVPGQHDDPDPGLDLARSGQQLATVQVGQAKVGDEQRIGPGAQQIERGRFRPRPSRRCGRRVPARPSGVRGSRVRRRRRGCVASSRFLP